MYKYLQSSTDPLPNGIAPCEPELGRLATVLNFPGPPPPIPIGDGLFPPAINAKSLSMYFQLNPILFHAVPYKNHVALLYYQIKFYKRSWQ